MNLSQPTPPTATAYLLAHTHGTHTHARARAHTHTHARTRAHTCTRIATPLNTSDRCAPLERVKIVLQTQAAAGTNYKGMLDCGSAIVKGQGVAALWTGNVVNCMRYFPTQAMNFAFKERCVKTPVFLLIEILWLYLFLIFFLLALHVAKLIVVKTYVAGTFLHFLRL